ncbi:LysR family transcriptional regulator [Glaciecola sp. MH2013]|uniref:LysR family transcriptional regulator n=1 Tax=Glaciecola sp. MH2013 TaxID=2785524 RepID=UPI0018A071B3|nr:LysR family transcriptional regulator [Glaciecola sp. MH2013]MBF7073588.1 LysR family transcriptional regulator [Glaciecola sp. MH2013]
MIIQNIDDAFAIVKAAKAGSFAKAARQMNMPVATFSRRIAKMETLAGVRFFDRTTRSLHITEVGKLIAQHAQRMIDEAKSAESLIESLRDTPSGTLHICAPLTFGQGLLSDALSQFLKTYPQCKATVELTNRQVDIVHEGFDIAIRAGKPGYMDVIAKKLCHLRAGFYCRTNSQHTKINKIEQLSNAPVAVLRPKDRYHIDLSAKDIAGDSIMIDCKPIFLSTNPWLVKQVSVQNDYVFTMPEFMQQNDSLHRLLPNYSTSSLDIYATYISRKQLRPAIREFVDILSASLQ